MVLLEMRNVSKTYYGERGTHTALKDVSLTVHQGEVVSLLGVNGAGKSTLSGIIATLHPATSGDVLYQGVSIYADVPSYRMRIGLCPQHPNLNPMLTIEQNLYFAGRAYRMTHEQAMTRTHELLALFDLADYAHKTIYVLSGGYKQRALLARSLMHSPSLIILDEPTVGLDPHVRYDLWEQIRSLRNQGTSIILTTHYMDEAEQLSDRVCVLDRGVIQLVGTPASLKAEFAKSSLESVFIELTKVKGTV